MAKGREAIDKTAERRRFGDRVRTLRIEAGLTQEQLSERSTVERSYLADIEAGGRNPTLDVIVRLATGLGLSPREFFD